ncbi:uncharacterized protein [Apostichopus japonicus]|uniref:uncharacterized protein n=1 Tax=Stichopus japonicus TaxID=307972 RepID=UPI003AB16CB2
MTFISRNNFLKDLKLINIFAVVLFSYLVYCGVNIGEGYDQSLIIPQPMGSSKSAALVIRSQDPTKMIDMKPSNFYDVTFDASGPILHNRHLIKSSILKSNSYVCDDGWNNTQVGQLVTLTIDVNVTTSRTVRFYSVLAVGENHIFAANQSILPVDSSLVKFTFRPRLPGVYNLYVEEVHRNEQVQLPGSPFHLVVHGDPVHAVDLGRRADKLPSCQTVSQIRRSWLDGDWITRKIAGTKRGVLRSGWVFQPSWCSFDIFTTEDLAAAAETTSLKTIAILGSSIERGIFFSLVDLLLAKEEKYKLTTSDFSQCWGFAQVQVGSLKVMYQDFRVENVFKVNISEDGKSEILCHDEKEAKSGNYDLFGEAMQFLTQYLFGKNPWPDLVVIAIKDVEIFKLLLKAIPSEWSGTIYPLYNFKAEDERLYAMAGLNRSYQLAEKVVSLDNRIQLIDGFGLGSGMRHNTQTSPLMLKSNHWHRWCNELNGEMRVCGNPTEMIAQILLGKVIAPVGKEAWLKSIGSRTKISFPREITVCQDCPTSLIPFHVKPNPNLKCYVTTEGILETSSAKQEVWDGTLCPEECLKMEPVDVINTESGPVNVRRCIVNLL